MDNRRVLNHMTPGSKRAGLGDKVDANIDAYNALVTKFNALLAKLDTAGATVTGLGTDYASTLSADPQPGLND